VISLAKFKKYAILTSCTILCTLSIQSCQAKYEDPGVAQYSNPPISEQVAKNLPELPADVAVADTPQAWTTQPFVSATPTISAAPVKTNLSSMITPSVAVKPNTTVAAALTGKSANTKATSKPPVITSYRLAINTNGKIANRYDDIARQTGYVEQYPEVDSQELVTYQGQRLHKDAAAAFDRLRQAAAKEGITLRIISGFRGIKSQTEIFAGKGNGLSAAAYSAPPGHSQHHTGLAIDINSLQPSFRTSKEFKWLKKNAPTYGFMLPYSNTSGDLGPNNEPWHWVYVGKSPAMQLLAGFLSRARQNNYDPLLGDNKLEEIYKAQTITAADPQISRQ
jgi:LAS superfamily LD-carboxypeptidase LdcB